jgi:hypothetical protein
LLAAALTAAVVLAPSASVAAASTTHYRISGAELATLRVRIIVTARNLGDRHPTHLRAVKTSPSAYFRFRAFSRLGAPQSEPIYVVCARGHFAGFVTVCVSETAPFGAGFNAIIQTPRHVSLQALGTVYKLAPARVP